MSVAKQILLLFLAASTALAGQTVSPLRNVEASLSVEKQNFLVGEPIKLIFTATYTGPSRQIELSQSDPYSNCSSYRFDFSPKEESREPKTGPPCAPLFQIQTFHCLIGAFRLVKGVETKERILLNRFHDFTKPGVYVVNASRHVSQFDLKSKNQPSGGSVSATLTFTISAPNSPEDIKAAFSPYLEELHSPAYQTRWEAAMALASLPAPFLEPYLLQMLSRTEQRNLAIHGLRCLNTAPSRAALFDLVKPDGSLSIDQQLAILALEDMGDAGYAPQLLALRNTSTDAEKKAKLLAAAARLDPANTFPLIQPLLTESDNATRAIGVTALAATEQPQVLPVLVNLLTDSSREVSAAAAQGLVSLTRHAPSEQGEFWTGAGPASAAPYWSAWLQANPDLPIHPIRECPQHALGW